MPAPTTPAPTTPARTTPAPSTRLVAAAGLAAAAAGAIFIGVQVGHPPVDVEHLTTTGMRVREVAKAVMCALAVVGLAGMFARSRARLGVVGHVGYALVTIGYLAMFVTQCLVGFVLPSKAGTDPGYVQDVLDAAIGGSPEGDIGAYPVLFGVAGLGFSIGGLLFGVAQLRAGVLSRCASALFAYGTASALALAVLPESFNRPFAVPTGVALIGLGTSLWRGLRPATSAEAPAVALPGLATR